MTRSNEAPSTEVPLTARLRGAVAADGIFVEIDSEAGAVGRVGVALAYVDGPDDQVIDALVAQDVARQRAIRRGQAGVEHGGVEDAEFVAGAVPDGHARCTG